MNSTKRWKIATIVLMVGLFLTGGLFGYYFAKWEDGGTVEQMCEKMDRASKQYHFSWDKVK